MCQHYVINTNQDKYKQIMSYKVVENYQLSQQTSSFEDGIQVFIAPHMVTKLPSLIKKMPQKDMKIKIQILQNEVSILRVIKGPQIIQCLRMLKTPNNSYLVYDYYDCTLLPQFIKNSTKQLKISIIVQLLDAFKLMASQSVVHCNLKPSNVLVTNDKKIKVFNFTYGHKLQGKKSIPIKYKPTSSIYVAPEILKQDIVHQKSDFYSLGVILSEMNLSIQGNYLGVQNNINIAKLPSIIQLLTSEDPNKRPDLQQLFSVFKASKQNSPRKKSIDVDSKNLVSPSNSIKRANSDSSETGKKIFSPNQENSKINQKKFIELVLKRRNLAIFLLQMSETCLKIQDQQKRLSIFLSYIFMKKSCKIICGLLSYLKNEKNSENQIQNVMDKNERANFQKKPDFFKIVSTIQKQASNQKRWLEDIYKNIASQLPTKLKQLSSLQEIDDRNFISYISQFLIYIVKESSIADGLTSKIAENLYLMSEIIPHKSYEKMFEEMISEQKISLDEQYLYIHVRKMDKKELVSQICARVKVK